MKKALWIFATVAAMGIATTAAAANSVKSHHKAVPAAQKKAHVNHSKHVAKAEHSGKSAAKPSAVTHKPTAHKATAPKQQSHKSLSKKPASKSAPHAKKQSTGSRLERRHA